MKRTLCIHSTAASTITPTNKTHRLLLPHPEQPLGPPQRGVPVQSQLSPIPLTAAFIVLWICGAVVDHPHLVNSAWEGRGPKTSHRCDDVTLGLLACPGLPNIHKETFQLSPSSTLLMQTRTKYYHLSAEFIIYNLDNVETQNFKNALGFILARGTFLTWFHAHLIDRLKKKQFQETKQIRWKQWGKQNSKCSRRER